MEVIDASTAMLSNFEVLQVLKEYAEEMKSNNKNDQNLSTIVYETQKYLSETPAAYQDPDIIKTVVKALLPFGLTKAEKLQMINLRPTTAVEISLIIEESEERVTEEQIEEILEIVSQLPAPEEENENSDDYNDNEENVEEE